MKQNKSLCDIIYRHNRKDVFFCYMNKKNNKYVNAKKKQFELTKLGLEKLKELYSFGCTDEEIYFTLGISKATYWKWKKKNEELISELSVLPKISLRRKMFQEAMSGNDKLMIHLSKQESYLGMNDKLEQKIDISPTINFVDDFQEEE